jgi:4-hydroxy-3-polyprenylbenzoate decarboxylase
MHCADLTSFVHLLEQADQLARVAVEVDPHLELAAIVDRVSKGAGLQRALLFERVRGSRLPVAANLFGTLERVVWALGTTDLAGLVARLEQAVSVSGAGSAAAALQRVAAVPQWQPVTVSAPPWREVDCSAEGLGLLPPIFAWPGDGGAYLTLAQVYTRHPEGGAINCGMYRIQCQGTHHATIRCRAGSGAARHLAAWHRRGQGMPVAVALGGPPALTWAAGAPLPDGVEEAAFCGFLTGQRMAMSACLTSDLQVPAGAEVVIEGVVEPGAVAAEGPFGNHTGSYDHDPEAPLLRVLTVHARHAPLCPWTLVGPPPMENLQLARVTEQLFLPLVRYDLPTVRQLHMPGEGIMHRAALVTVDPGEARPLEELAGLLWQTPLLQGARLLVVGLADHDPHDAAAVFWRTLNRVDWGRDLLVQDGRLAVDARRLPPGAAVRSDPTIVAAVLARWRDYRIDPDLW